MKKLIEGLKKFQASVFAEKQALFSRLAKGQQPHTLFITCSDSRVDPNLLTQTDPGELFILRNAGNVIPGYGAQIGGTTATIEYAVGVLKVQDIVVCGHTDCGFAKGLLDPSTAKDLPALQQWLLQSEAVRRILQENYSHLTGEARLEAAIQENVRVQLTHLRTHPLLAAKLRSGTVALHGWVYSISTGQVWTFDEGRDQFVSISSDFPKPSAAAKKRK